MENKTFEDYLKDKCPCHTNNSHEGYEKWLGRLDAQEFIEFAEDYGRICYTQGGMELVNK